MIILIIQAEAQEALVQQVFNKFKKLDILIVIIVAILSLSVFLIFSTQQGTVVTVSVSGELYGTYSLFDNSTIEVATDNGNITVAIENSKVFVLQSDCKDAECIKQRNITKKGQSIICLPLETVITIGEGNYELVF